MQKEWCHSSFWRTLEMNLINCQINLILTNKWSANCIISVVNRATTLAITDKKLYVPAVTLSINDNVKLIDQLKSGFKRTNKWNKYQSKVTIHQRNPYLCYLIDSILQEVNRFFV